MAEVVSTGESHMCNNSTVSVNNDNDGNVLDNEVRQPLSRPDDHSEESDDNTMNTDEQCLLPQN